MKGLIVTADDFGAAPEVNAAVEMAHRQGVLTAASLMVTGPAAEGAAAVARRNPSLAVGLHLVLVEGRPALPASEVPDLVDHAGRFQADMARAGAMMFFKPAARRQLEAEIAAQFQAFAATGLTLDHVNAHKHFHLHPTIAWLVVKIGVRHGLTAARVPGEPRRVLAAIEPDDVHRPDPVMGPWTALTRRRFRRAGLLIPDQVFGLAWSGAMTAPRLRGLIDHLPAGLSEIYVHPATAGGFDGAAPGYRYAEELAALTAPEVMAVAKASGARLGGFADFARTAG